MDKAEFMRQWAVAGMPADKIRLANAAWDAAIAHSTTPIENQCDGCQQGAPLLAGLHVDSAGRPFMACQKSKYAPSARRTKEVCP